MQQVYTSTRQAKKRKTEMETDTRCALKLRVARVDTEVSKKTFLRICSCDFAAVQQVILRRRCVV